MRNTTNKCLELVETARIRKMWIYDPSYKKWYSPEVFLETFGDTPLLEESFYKGMQIRHPIDGIQAGFKILQETQDKLREFTKQVTEYYKR